MIPVGQRFFGEAIGPIRRLKGHGMAHVPGGKHQAGTHGYAIRLLGRPVLAICMLAFPPIYPIRAGHCRQRAVSGSVHKYVRCNFIGCFARQLYGGNGADAAALYLRAGYMGIQQKREIGLPLTGFPQNGIQRPEIGIGVLLLYGQQQFFQNARFPQIGSGAVSVRAANMHAEFAGRIAAQHGTVLNQYGSDAVPPPEPRIRRIGRRLPPRDHTFALSFSWIQASRRHYDRC